MLPPARFGLRGALAPLGGDHLATWIMTLAIGLGVMAALEGHPGILRTLTLAGAAYVLWLGWRIAPLGTLDDDATAVRALPPDHARLHPEHPAGLRALDACG